MRAGEKKRRVYLSNTRNEVEEGRKRVELAEWVGSGDREDELDKHAASYTDR